MWISRGRTSLRAWQNTLLEQEHLGGRVLELGSTSSTVSVFQYGLLVRSNITPSVAPDVCFDIENGFPFHESVFDVVVALNVLEHIFEQTGCLREAHRVLRPGGELIVAIPFLYRIHPSPEDYHRLTATSLIRLVQSAGFADIRVEENGTGSCLAGYSLIDPIGLPGWLRVIPSILAVAGDELCRRLAEARGRTNYRGPYYYPLGYTLRARA
jgi:SAM-dependent methyltransferase